MHANKLDVKSNRARYCSSCSWLWCAARRREGEKEKRRKGRGQGQGVGQRGREREMERKDCRQGDMHAGVKRGWGGVCKRPRCFGSSIALTCSCP